MSQYLTTAKNTLYKNIWGQHSLNIGEALVLLLALVIIYFHLLGKWSFWVAVLVIFVGLWIF